VFGHRVRSNGPTGGQVPPGAQYAPGTDIGPALLPVPAMSFQAYQSNGQIHGAPGTVRIPAPAPFPELDRSPVAQATEGPIGLPSSDFSYWRPDVWYQTDVATMPDRAGGVCYLNSTHEMPVPAVRPNVIMVTRSTNSPGGITPATGAFAARLGGKWPIGWPKATTYYPETRGLSNARGGYA
jgi:hypothetical protein